MSIRREDARGWIGSLVIHLLVALILFLWKLDISASTPEYIEVRWGSVATVSTPIPVHPSARASKGNVSAVHVTRSGRANVSTPIPMRPSVRKSAGTVGGGSKRKSLDLPERRFANDDEVLRLPPATKMGTDGSPVGSGGQGPANFQGIKDRGVGSGTGQKESFIGSGGGEGAGGVAEPAGPVSFGSDVGSAVSVSMQWSDGGNRKKISGALPEYPPGANVEAKIRIEITVVPDGSVKALKPAQKSDTKLEEAAMKEVRLWKFEPLR